MRDTGNERFKRVSKTVARRHWLNGGGILILPCNVNFRCQFIKPYAISGNQNSTESQFNTLVELYEFYNCNNEVGKYASFYIQTVPDDML